MPWNEWIGGIVFVASSIAAQIFVSYEMKPIGHVQPWLSIFLLLGVFFVGCCFIYAGEIETTTFDKEQGTMILTRWRITCARTFKCHSLDTIAKVSAVKRGVLSKGASTQHYVLMIFFKDPSTLEPVDLSQETSASDLGDHTTYRQAVPPPVKILSTKNDLKIKKELLCLRKFLDLDLDQPLRIVD